MSKPVAEFFDRKAAPWGEKYRADGKLLGRLTLFADALREAVPAPASVLDLGCGTGNLANHLQKLGYSLTGADISPAMLSKARETFPAEGIEFVQLDPQWPYLPFEDARFKAITASSVFEYADDLKRIFAELFRVLTPGGVVLCSVPDVRHPVRWVEAIAKRAAGLPIARNIVARSSRLARYAQYLDISRNRMSRASWAAIARSTGFSERPARQSVPVGTLALLVFERS